MDVTCWVKHFLISKILWKIAKKIRVQVYNTVCYLNKTHYEVYEKEEMWLYKIICFNTIRKTGHSKQQVWLGVIDTYVLILNGETKALTRAEVNKERLLRDNAVPVDYSHADDGPHSL